MKRKIGNQITFSKWNRRQQIMEGMMAKPQVDIWQFQRALTRRLLKWATFSFNTGLGMLPRKDMFWRGFGTQCVGWGAINGAIGWFGDQNSQQKSAEDDAHTSERQVQEQEKLAKFLWINTGLDVGYITGGLILSQTKGKENRFWRGTGWGIVLQGVVLFGFDLIHALLLIDLE